MLKRMDAFYLKVTLALSVMLMQVVSPASCFSQSVGFNGATLGEVTFPWTKFLNSLAKELTGPLPVTLGILGLAAAAIALFAGNGGAGTQKFIMLIFAVSICLFAPTFISYVSTSAGGATIGDALGTVEAAGSVAASAGVLP